MRERQEIQALPRSVAAAGLWLLVVLGPQALDLGSPAAQPSWSLSVPPSVTSGLAFAVTVEVHLPEGYYQDTDSEFLSLEPGPGARVVMTSSSPPVERAGKSSFRGTFTLTRTVVLSPTSPGPLTLSWTFGWQICQVDGICLLPSHETKSVTLQVLPTPGALPPWLVALVGALVGGLLLNVMPCVFPVLALKVLPRNRSRRANRLFAAGTVAGLGILGLLTAAAAWAGQRLDWGFSFQSAPFLWALALGFWVLVLRLWGLWSFRAPGVTVSRNPLWGPLGGGAAFVLTAAPCTAPLLGPALGFALTQPPAVIPLYFTAVGLGLAAPLILLTEIPVLARLLPRPGAWLSVAEKVAGAVLVLTVIYMLWLLAERTSAQTAFVGAVSLVIVAPFLWLWGRKPTRTGTVALGVLVLGLTVAVLAVPGHQETPPPAPWHRYSAQALQSALDEGRPVFVDGTAAWCATCQVNDWAVLGQKDVLERMQSRGIVLLRADFTRPNPEVQAWLASIGRAGLPAYALYLPKNSPILFPELLLKEPFLDQLNKVLSPTEFGRRSPRTLSF